MDSETDFGAKLLEDLAGSRALEALGSHVPRMTFMRALGLPRAETAHSRILAYLLDSDRSSIAVPLSRALLKEVAKEMGSARNLSLRFDSLARGSPLSSRAMRERWHIDVLVEIEGEGGPAVLGIEKKIDAGEQRDQVRRYQEILAEGYPGWAAALIFLTPDGREPTTGDDGVAVPWVAIGYESVADALDGIILGGGLESDAESIARNFAIHIREEIMGEAHVKTLVTDLWREHPKALRLCIKYRPRLEDVKDAFVRILRSSVEEDLFVRFYPERRGDAREVKVSVKPWWVGGMPFTFMLTENDQGLPWVGLFFGRDQFAEREADFIAWAKQVNASGADFRIDEHFPRWGWWHQAWERDFAAEGLVGEGLWDESAAREAAELVTSWIEMLRPHVERFLVPGTTAIPASFQDGGEGSSTA